MLTKVFMFFIVIQVTYSQVDGGFWWLKPKAAKMMGAFPSMPVIEELKKLETDYSDRIVFRDDDVPFVTREKYKDIEKAHIDLHFQDKSKLSFNATTNFAQQNNTDSNVDKNNESSRSKESIEDIFDFSFPDAKLSMNTVDVNQSGESVEITQSPELVNQNTIKSVNTIAIHSDEAHNTGRAYNRKAENICTYTSKTVCDRHKGIAYTKFNYKVYTCCVLPLGYDEKSAKITFPDELASLKRTKRSDLGHAQRNAVLQRMYTSSFNNFNPRLPTSPTKVVTRIVTPGDDGITDPYWNIKTQQNKNDYVNDEYTDYASELPQPGLLGLGLDYGQWPAVSKKPYGGGSFSSEEDDVDDSNLFGYSTMDPRKEWTGRPARTKLKPIKIKTSSNEDYSNSERETVHYHSIPDFKVLEGFKLRNLSLNRTKSYSKNTKITTVDYDSGEYLPTRPTPVAINLDSEYPDFMDLPSGHKDCDRMRKNERQSSNSLSNGSAPWLALATRTRAPKQVLCYATIVHPKAAVTAAECVHGMSPGEVTILAGIWDLTEDSGISQHRMTSVQEHPQYVRGSMANNIALLHWKVPLRFGPTVRAACMSDPHVGDECYFVGWGGYDIAMRPRPRRQSATILTPRACKTRLSSNKPGLNLPKDAFCATIDHQNSVTGTGGPLTCKIDEKATLVGIAVLRDNVIVLLPVDWAQQAVASLGL